MQCVRSKTCVDFDDADNFCHDEQLAESCSYRRNGTQTSKPSEVEE